MNSSATFSSRIAQWQKQQGRHHLPWQVADAYRVWLSEIMLQQTQVSTVINYYTRFINTFPDVATLAKASEDSVLALWSGLGYYARARNLHASAKIIHQKWGDKFPTHRTELETLPGIGRTTAAAICVFAFGQREAILDGNVKRVLARHFALDTPTQHTRPYWILAEKVLSPITSIRAYTQGLMDLGSMICTRTKPNCLHCPVHITCLANTRMQQDQYPRRLPKKKKPSREAYFLLCRDKANAIYLEKRVQQTIWRGLWALPCFKTPTARTRYANRYQLYPDPQAARYLHTIVHQFTHFTLTLHLAYYRTNQHQLIDFFTADACLAKGLPAPIRHAIIQMLQSDSHTLLSYPND